MEKQKTFGFVTSKRERLAYCLFFLGQNILWGYAGYVETFLTDIGITAAMAAAILLILSVNLTAAFRFDRKGNRRRKKR